MNYYYSDKLGQFKEFSSRLNKLIDNGTFYRLSSEKRSMLISRLKRLFNQLLSYVPELKLKHILAAAAIFVLSLGAGTAHGQSFAAPQTNPFGLVNVNTLVPNFVDIDGDGDFDLFVGVFSGALQYFENTGDSTAPAFTVPQINPFGLVSVNSWAYPSFVDIDGDGDFDVFVGEYGGAFQYFENTGTDTVPVFAAPQPNPFGLDSVNGNPVPNFVDIDGDGDFDVLVGEYGGALQYFENTGTNTAPAFDTAQTNPFGLVSVNFKTYPSFVDIDGDGDFDVFVGEYGGALQYFENTGTNTVPAFAAPQVNPFGLVSVLGFASPDFVDIDGDGDFDAFVWGNGGDLKYFENTSPTGIKENKQTANVTIYPNPAKDKFAVQFNGVNGSGSVTLEVTNSIGQVILKEKAAGSENGYSFEISTAAYDKGLYFVKIKTKDNVIIRKLVVE